MAQKAKKSKSKTQNFYDRIADVQNLAMKVNGYRASVAKFLRSLDLRIDANSLVLDAGSGTGIVTLGFHSAGFRPRKTIALDLSFNSLDVSREQFEKDPFHGKIVILTDYGTGSTSEVFAAGMQDLGRAKIVGEATAGAVLPSVMEKLPTGALFQYAIADYKSPNKILIEGRGVKPDIEVNLTRRSLLKGQDLQMETAVKEILRKQ